MAASESSPEELKKTEDDKICKEMVRIFQPSVALTVMGGAMLFSARQAIAMKQFKSVSEVTIFLSRLASLGALFEFLLNPVLGKLADAYGRRCILPIGNLATVIVRLLLFCQPNKKWPIVLEQLMCIPLVTSFFTVYRAVVADHLSGAAFATANAQIGMGAGVGIVVGPLFATSVMSRADPKYCYLLSVLFASGSLANLYVNVKESLPVEKRKPLVVSDMQPFSFLKLMNNRVMTRLMTTTGLQTLSEGRNINDILTIYMVADLKWSWTQINTFVSAYGSSLIISGLAVKSMLKSMGLRQFTTFSNVANILSLGAWGMVPPFSLLGTGGAMYIGLLFAAPGGRKRDAVETLIQKLGNEQGFGNAFISSSMMNLRAIINVAGPLLFGSIYAYGAKRKWPSFAFLVAALTVLAAEGVWRTLGLRDLGLDDSGHIKTKEADEAKQAKNA